MNTPFVNIMSTVILAAALMFAGNVRAAPLSAAESSGEGSSRGVSSAQSERWEEVGPGWCVDSSDNHYDYAAYNIVDGSLSLCKEKCEEVDNRDLVGLIYSSISIRCGCLFTAGFITSINPGVGNCPSNSIGCHGNAGGACEVAGSDYVSDLTCYKNRDFGVDGALISELRSRIAELETELQTADTKILEKNQELEQKNQELEEKNQELKKCCSQHENGESEKTLPDADPKLTLDLDRLRAVRRNLSPRPDLRKKGLMRGP